MDSWDSVFGSGKIVCKTLDAIAWKADHVPTELVTDGRNWKKLETGYSSSSLFVTGCIWQDI